VGKSEVLLSSLSALHSPHTSTALRSVVVGRRYIDDVSALAGESQRRDLRAGARLQPIIRGCSSDGCHSGKHEHHLQRVARVASFAGSVVLDRRKGDIACRHPAVISRLQVWSGQ